MPLPTLQGEPFHRYIPFLVFISKQTFLFSDTGYMKTSGSCPICEGSRPRSSLLWLALVATLFVSINSEIGSETGPLDITMLPIWRGGSLSSISCLGFRVSLSSLRTYKFSHSHQSNSSSILPPPSSPHSTRETPAHARCAARSPLGRDAFCDVWGAAMLRHLIRSSSSRAG